MMIPKCTGSVPNFNTTGREIGVVMMMATSPMIALFATPPPHWGIDPLADQNIAGALAWSYGEPVALIIVTIFAIRWHRDERRDNAVAERYTAEAITFS